MESAPASLWINLGEARSKCEHISGVPLRPSTAEDLQKIYLAKGVLGTTAIEGNTLTEDQVRKHLDGDLKLPPSQEYLQQEIDNTLKACNSISKNIISGNALPLDVSLIKHYNQTVLDKLTLELGVTPGEIRKHSVGVGRYLGAPAEDCEYLLNKLCEWIAGSDFKATDGNDVIYALIKAIVSHLYIAWIHPFGDGNGRTARLIEFQILLEAGLPLPAAHLLSNHYNLTRQEYYRQLDSASKSGGDILPFIAYAVQGFVDGLRDQLSLIRDQQWDITWRNYVFERFKNKEGISEKRQRGLVFDLGQLGEVVDVSKISELTPSLARSYSKKTLRTIQRDVESLEQMGLIVRDGGGIRANREVILAFLPLKRNFNDPQMKLL